MADGHGLVRVVRAQGVKVWRYEYRVNGKEEKLNLCTYPAYSMTEAHRDHQNGRLLVEGGISPLGLRRDAEAAAEGAALAKGTRRLRLA